MERLTEWNGRQPRDAYYPRCFEEPCYGGGCKINDCPFETAVCERLAAYEDTGLTPEQCENVKVIIESAFSDDTSKAERIRELLKADKEGRLVVLPCRQGDELWTYGNFPQGREVYRFTVSDVSTLNGRTVLNTLGFGTIRPEDIGKTVFLSREEAEKALQEMEGKKDG